MDQIFIKTPKTSFQGYFGNFLGPPDPSLFSFLFFFFFKNRASSFFLLYNSVSSSKKWETTGESFLRFCIVKNAQMDKDRHILRTLSLASVSNKKSIALQNNERQKMLYLSFYYELNIQKYSIPIMMGTACTTM